MVHCYKHVKYSNKINFRKRKKTLTSNNKNYQKNKARLNLLTQYTIISLRK